MGCCFRLMRALMPACNALWRRMPPLLSGLPNRIRGCFLSLTLSHTGNVVPSSLLAIHGDSRRVARTCIFHWDSSAARQISGISLPSSHRLTMVLRCLHGPGPNPDHESFPPHSQYQSVSRMLLLLGPRTFQHLHFHFIPTLSFPWLLPPCSLNLSSQALPY